MTPVQNSRDLDVYRLAYRQAMQCFEMTKSFPEIEKFALTSQIRRASRSVCTNLTEAWAKRRYEAHFLSKLTDTDGENMETRDWLNFAKDCGYITQSQFNEMFRQNAEIGGKIGAMIKNRHAFLHPDVRRSRSAD